MGQTESTDKETLFEPQQESVKILLSEKVYNRLTSEPQSVLKEPDKRSDVNKSSMTNYMRTKTSGYDVYEIDNEPLADKESEITRNKNYWKKRLEDLQDSHEKIKVILETEKEKGFKDAQASLPTVAGKQGETPCAENLGAIKDCYKTNAKEPLNCEKEVNEFVSCLKGMRMDVTNKTEEEVDGKNKNEEELGVDNNKEGVTEKKGGKN